jgi:hypothetical protein
MAPDRSLKFGVPSGANLTDRMGDALAPKPAAQPLAHHVQESSSVAATARRREPSKSHHRSFFPESPLSVAPTAGPHQVQRRAIHVACQAMTTVFARGNPGGSARMRSHSRSLLALRGFRTWRPERPESEVGPSGATPDHDLSQKSSPLEARIAAGAGAFRQAAVRGLMGCAAGARSST